MSKNFILSIDQGTTSCRAILFDQAYRAVHVSQQEFRQHYPHPGWVEHDPHEILGVQKQVMKDVVTSNGIDPNEISAIGITNQRETTVAWSKKTGKALMNAIVWQDKRSKDICKRIIDNEFEEKIRDKTGLVVDTYFSATKMAWMLENNHAIKGAAVNNDLFFGTIDSWLIYNLTNQSHFTDVSNASRTMLFNIHDLTWDREICEFLDIPVNALPEVKRSSDDFGTTDLLGIPIPIYGVAGDQQAALYGQACYNPGDAKNTYGTGCFMLLNTGNEAKKSKTGLLTTIAWDDGEEINYALEGSVFVAGSAVQWLRDGLKILSRSADSEQMATEADQESTLVVVPAFVGLGAPHWDMNAAGSMFGITHKTGPNEIAKATLESIAFQSSDLIECMLTDSGTKLNSLSVDGGATDNMWLMQFQADVLGMDIIIPENKESTALGAALLAGKKSGFYSKEHFSQNRRIHKTYHSKMDDALRIEKIEAWQKAIDRSKNWY